VKLLQKVTSVKLALLRHGGQGKEERGALALIP